MLGWVSALLFVHRTMSTCAPLTGTAKSDLPLPEAVLAFILAELGLPPALATVTREIDPRHPRVATEAAIPRASVRAPACRISPALMLVMKERGTSRLIGTNLTRLPRLDVRVDGVTGRRPERQAARSLRRLVARVARGSPYRSLRKGGRPSN